VASTPQEGSRAATSAEARCRSRSAAITSTTEHHGADRADARALAEDRRGTQTSRWRARREHCTAAIDSTSVITRFAPTMP
jgi:hypothetical protein